MCKNLSNIQVNTKLNQPFSDVTFFLALLLQKSSVCRAAVHAGVIKNDMGGYVDVMPVDKRRHYTASYQNGIVSERYGTSYDYSPNNQAGLFQAGI